MALYRAAYLIDIYFDRYILMGFFFMELSRYRFFGVDFKIDDEFRNGLVQGCAKICIIRIRIFGCHG